MESLHATVTQNDAERETRKADLIARARALGWSQNELARRAGCQAPHFSRVLNGVRASARVWKAAERALRKAERRRKAA